MLRGGEAVELAQVRVRSALREARAGPQEHCVDGVPHSEREGRTSEREPCEYEGPEHEAESSLDSTRRSAGCIGPTVRKFSWQSGSN